MQQLSIGNVVNLGIYLYRARLKLYFKLALAAHLWLLVPIYGWAKFYAIAGLMSRLAFQELVGHPENLKTAQSRIQRQFWKFLFTSISVIFIVFILVIIFYILLCLIITILFLLSAYLLKVNFLNLIRNSSGIVVRLIVIITYLSPFLFYSWLFITDLPLALEKNINPFQAIGKSWQITKGYIRRILGIMLISVLITLPVVSLSWFVCNFLFLAVLGIFFQDFLDNYDNDYLIFILNIIIFNIVNGVFTMPFWQAVKSVVYYDIRCRKEGFDVKLSNDNTKESDM